MTRINYTLGGHNLRTEYGIEVAASTGVLDRPKIKEPESRAWSEHNGSVVDLAEKRVQERDITLNCFMTADSETSFLTRVNAFMDIFDASGTLRLQIDLDADSRPLVYEVYAKDSIAISKKWSSGKMVGTFSLKLTEPDPVKRVVKFATASASITLTTASAVVIHWGDGTHSEDTSGEAVTATHTYTDGAASHIAIISGVISKITAFSVTGGEIIWNKL